MGSNLALLAMLFAALMLGGHAHATEPRQFDYMLNCQGCHLPDGSGNPQRQVPPFPGQLGKFLSVPGGREYLVQVPGSALSGLSDEALAGVLNWMLETFSAAELPDGFKPYTGKELHGWRQQPPVDVELVRAELIQRIALQDEKREK